MMAYPIPKAAQARLQAMLGALAARAKPKTNALRTEAISPGGSPSGQCVDAQDENSIVGFGGDSCTVAETSGAFFGSCNWSFTTATDAATNPSIAPITAPAGSTSYLHFTIPPNNTQDVVLYTVQGTCSDAEFTFDLMSLPMAERDCGRCNAAYSGKPIDAATGEEYYTKTDLALSGPYGLVFARAYASETLMKGGGDVGNSWNSSYDERLDVSELSNKQIAYYDWTGLPTYFSGVAAGGSSYDSISGMTLALSTDGSTYTLKSFSNETWIFNAKGEVTKTEDRIGNTQTLTRDTTSGHNDRVVSVSDPLSRQLCFFYDSSNRITEVSTLASGTCPTTAPTSGTLVKLVYDSGTNCATGQLCTVTEPDAKTWKYQYVPTSAGQPFANDLSEVDDPLGNPEEVNTYSGYQVLTQHSGTCSSGFPCADTGDDLSYNYGGGISSQTTTITDGEGRASTITYDEDSLLLTQISGPVCQCGGDQTRTIAYDANERIQTVSDDGVDGSTKHTYTLAYTRDSGSNAYPGPNTVTENLDSSGTTRKVSLTYYAIGDTRQDLVQTTILPSADVPGNTMQITDAYSSGGERTQRAVKGFVNGTSTTYTWKWAFDSRGRLTTYTGPRTDLTQTTTYGYFSDTDSDHVRAGQLSTITDALSHVTHFASASGYTTYDVYGNPKSVVDANAATYELSYDARGRLLTSTLLGVTGDTANLVTTYGYDSAGRLTSKKMPLGNSVALGYDTSDRVTSLVRDDSSSLQHERATFSYNTFDQQTGLAAQSCTTPAASCSSWTTAFSQSYAYSPATSDLAKITNADSTSSTVAFDDAGALSTFNDENHTTGADYSDTYDVAGRQLTSSRYLAGATNNAVSGTYVHDVHDNVTSFTDENGNVTTFHFDDFDRLTKEVSPVQGTTTITYDPASNVLTLTDANASTTTRTYDALDRPLTEKAVRASATQSTSWAYDDTTAGDFGIGRLHTMTDPSGSTTYKYERRGNVVSQARVIVGNSFAQDYTYDGNGNMATLDYPDGRVVTYTYDFADRPYSAVNTGTMTPSAVARRASAAVPHTATPETPSLPRAQQPGAVRIERSGVIRSSGTRGAATPSVGSAALTTATYRQSRPAGNEQLNAVKPQAGSASNYVTAASYLPFGPRSSVTFGNGTVQTTTFTSRYFPKENKLVSGSTTVADHVYTEDSVGNITGISDALSTGYSRTFKFDDLNRLTTAATGASLWGSAAGNGYTYDPMGNLKTLALGTSRVITFTPKVGTGSSVGLSELSKVVENGTTYSPTYDAVGNEATDGTATYSYSPRELLGSDNKWVSAYYYDGFRQRVSTTVSSTSKTRDSFFDDSQHLIAETADFASGATPSIGEEYIWFGDLPVAQIDGTTTRWTFGDHLGTPLVQTDINGAVQWQAEYEPFGRVYALRSNDVHQPLRFRGQASEQFDTGANGLTPRSYNNARWYRSDWGRYTQADPLHVSLQSHLYAYGSNAPTSRVDSSGLFSFGDLGGEASDIGEGVAEGISGGIAPANAIGTGSTAFEVSAEVASVLPELLPGLGLASDFAKGERSALRAVHICDGTFPDYVFVRKAPTQVAPGVNGLEGIHINDQGRVEPWFASYDNYGRRTARTDYNAGNATAGIPDVHHSTYGYGPSTPFGQQAGNHIPGEHP